VIRFVALVALLLLPTVAAADLGGFSIQRFDVEIEVQGNSDLVVTERIEVEFTEPRRGIYREIPIRYTDPSGYQYGYGFRLLGVTDENGDARTTKVRRKGAMVRIRIGDPDRRVTGTQVYYVRYHATDVLRQFAEHDELYWNVTGHRWNVPIREATLRVSFPEAIASGDFQVTGWAGRFGSRDSNVIAVFPQPGEVNVASQVQLGPREGLTVAVAWPPGIVSFPGPATKIWRFVRMNFVVLFPLIALVLLVRRYRRHGVDPTIQAAVMVRYEPPPGLSAGAVGTIVDEKVDMIDITATIVDLAVRGYLTIETVVEEKFFGLKKDEITSFRRDPDQSIADLLPHERLVLDGLFEADPAHVTTEDLKEEFYTHIPRISSALYDRIVDRKLVAGNPQTVRRMTVGIGFAAGIATAGVGMFWAAWQGAVFPNALVVPVACAIVIIGMFSAFAPAMPRRTREGVRVAEWAKGFEEFVDRVEADRFERDAARDVFEKLLPYAMALGVATKWSRKFEGIYDEKGPGWYVGPHGTPRGFSTVAFHASLSDAMTSASESMASRPRSSGSSGSGGGGFSGGGGGGGGGGSW
jgi:uncharacterized membrane protein YgcG